MRHATTQGRGHEGLPLKKKKVSLAIGRRKKARANTSSVS